MHSDRTEQTAFRTLLACCVGHTACHLTMLLFPTLRLVMSQSGSLRISDVDWAYGASCMLFGVGAPAAGWFTDRVGAKVSLAIFFLGLSAGLGVLGLVPGLLGLWIGMIVLGLANSMYHPAGMTAISLTQHARRGRSMGVLGIAGSLGVATGPLLGGVLGKWLGWQGACLAVAAMMLVVAVGSWAMVPARKHMMAIDTAGMAKHADKVGKKGGRGALMFLLLAMMCQGFVYRLMMTSTPEYVESLPWPGWFDLGWVGAITAAGMLLGAAGQVAGGWWSDSASAGYVYPRVVVITIAALLGVFFLPGFFGLAVLAIFLMTHFAAQPVENVLMAQRTASANRSLGFGMKFVLAFGVGSVAVKVVGILGGAGLLDWVFLVGAFVAMLGVGCIYAAAWMDRPEKTKDETSTSSSIKSATTHTPAEKA